MCKRAFTISRLSWLAAVSFQGPSESSRLECWPGGYSVPLLTQRQGLRAGPDLRARVPPGLPRLPVALAVNSEGGTHALQHQVEQSRQVCSLTELSTKSWAPCSVAGHVPTLPWVRSRVWVRVKLGSGLASRKGRVGTWPELANAVRKKIAYVLSVSPSSKWVTSVIFYFN